MSAAVKYEDYSIGLLSGTLVLSRLELSGWGALASTLRTKTDNGRLWGRITTGNVLELWRRPVFTVATDRMCVSGVIAAAGPVTINADNSSGISGSADVDYTLGTEQLFDVVLSYASEEDVGRQYAGLEGELTENKYNGEDVRFESLLKSIKRNTVDRMLWEEYGRARDSAGALILDVDAIGRPNLAKIADPRQIEEVQSLFCVSAIYRRRAALDPEFMTAANQYHQMATRLLENTQVAFDLTRNNSVDERKLPDRTLERA